MSNIFEIEKLDSKTFSRYQKALSPLVVPIEQSLQWGEFDSAIKNRSFLGSFAYKNSDGTFIALASATLYHERGRDWIWIKHGPLFATVPNTDTIKKMCATLKRQFESINSSRPLFVRISIPNKTGPLRVPFEHTMYDETIILDLEKDESELLADMNQSGRRGIRKAEKLGVAIKEVTKDIVQTFETQCYPILKETGSRDKFGIHPLSLYTNMLRKLPKYTRLYVAKKDNVVVAWALTTEYANKSMYYYGGSNRAAHETSAAYLLHWEIIKSMKKCSNVTYDFMGIAGEHFPSLQNVTQFKLKFSKEISTVPPTFDLPLRSIKYVAVSTAIKAKRKL